MTQPTDLTYGEGENLALAGLVVRLRYNDNSTADVAFADFGANSITANPANGTAMVVATHNGQPVAVSCNGHTGNTANLTVIAGNNASFTGAKLDLTFIGSTALLKLTGMSGVQALSTFDIKKIGYFSDSMNEGYTLDGVYNKAGNLEEVLNTEGKYFYSDGTKVLTISLTSDDLAAILYGDNDKVSAAQGWNKTQTDIQAAAVGQIVLIYVD